jgi:hypothetical protein
MPVAPYSKPTEQDLKNFHLGLYDPASLAKPTTLTDEQAMELFRSNGRNHPRTRMSVAERVVSLRKNQAQKQPEQNLKD